MKKGFTLIEVLIATIILTGAILAILSTLIQCSNLQESSKNLSLTISAARAKVEEMRNVDFSDLITDYNGPFDVSGLNAKGRVDTSYVAGSSNKLINVRVVICWRQKGGRIIGEDNGAGAGTALDGILHNDEDADGDGETDSPCVVDTSIANKEL
jgi:type II secretory pathway pseudopilin PulG